MAVQISIPSLPIMPLHHASLSASFASCLRRRPTFCCRLSDQQAAAQVAVPSRRGGIDGSLLSVSEACSEDELWAAACLRVRTFYDFDPDRFGVEDHRKYLTEHEFEALKERVAGKTKGFRRVSCINATLPMSAVLNMSNDLCASCKFPQNGENRVVVGTLDVNQCVSLPNEVAGMKPKGIGADFARAYISNVCVAKELHRNGLGYQLIVESKKVAEAWGISDLYVHVAVDNEAAKNLYMKCGFTLESDEPAWQARFLDRPRRLLLWKSLPITYELECTPEKRKITQLYHMIMAVPGPEFGGGYDALFMFPKLVRCRFQQRHGCSCTVSDLHFSKLKSSSWLSSKGNTGEPAFNLFLHPDLTFSVSAPLIAASGAVQLLRKFWQQTIDMIFCLRVFQSIWCTIVSRL